MIPAKIVGEKVEVYFAKVGGAVFFYTGAFKKNRWF